MMPMQMDPAASRAVAGPLPVAQAPAQRRDAEKEVAQALEIIPGRLFHYVAKWQPTETEEAHFFSIDATLVYEPFAFDFGPLHCGRTFRFCELMRMKLRDPALTNKRIYYYCTAADERFASNAAVLIGAFMIIWEGKTAKEAYAPFAAVRAKFAPYRDASYWPSDFDVTVADTLDGIYKAVTLGWVDFRSFDLQQFEFFEAVENGDLTVVIPGKFVAFAGPSYNGWTPPPAYYAQHFKRMGVTTVIRTNNKLYDRTEFTRYGIKHYDLFFPDGTPPPEAQAKRFLSIVESEPGMVAVHCKAGLGRTGTLILMWAMKHFRWGANEAIGYLRWMRPGSIIGPQQQFLKANESRLWRMGQNAQAREAAMAAAAQPGQTMHSHTGTNGNGSSSSSGNGSGGNGSGGRVSSGPPDARQQAMAMEKHRPASSQQALGGGVSSMSVSASHLNGGQAQDRPTTFGGGGSGSRRSNGKSRSSSRGGVSGSGRRIRTGRSGLDGLGGSGHSKGAGGGGGGGPAGSNVVDEWRNQTSTLRFGRANGTASGSVSPGGEKPMHHRLTHSLNGSLQAAANQQQSGGGGSGYGGQALGQKLAKLNGSGSGSGGGGGSRLGGAPRSFDEIARGSGGQQERGGGGGGGGLSGGLTRSMPALQPLRGTQRASSRGSVGVPKQQQSSSSAAIARAGGNSRGGPRQQPRLAFGEPAGGGGGGGSGSGSGAGEFRASVGSTGGRKDQLSPIRGGGGSRGGIGGGNSGGGGGGGGGGGVSESASVGAMPFLNAR